jgi:hypothetical protein
MPRKHLSAALPLLSLLTVAACSHPQAPPPLPEQNTRLIYPALPATTCARLPAVPGLTASDNEWAAYKKARDDAGDDCRDKLDSVDQVRRGWPQ